MKHWAVRDTVAVPMGRSGGFLDTPMAWAGVGVASVVSVLAAVAWRAFSSEGTIDLIVLKLTELQVGTGFEGVRTCAPRGHHCEVLALLTPSHTHVCAVCGACVRCQMYIRHIRVTQFTLFAIPIGGSLAMGVLILIARLVARFFRFLTARRIVKIFTIGDDSKDVSLEVSAASVLIVLHMVHTGSWWGGIGDPDQPWGLADMCWMCRFCLWVPLCVVPCVYSAGCAEPPDEGAAGDRR